MLPTYFSTFCVRRYIQKFDRIHQCQPTAAEINETVFFCYWYYFNHPADQLIARLTINLTQYSITCCHYL